MEFLVKSMKITFVFCFFYIYADAQFATIPDSNFVNWLNNNGFSSCLSGNQLDTTCNEVINAAFIDCSGENINDLTGICYFVNLLSLSCHDNHIILLSPLPSSLVFFDCSVNQLTGIPTLPPNLTSLFCDLNQLTSLPALPASLTSLFCSENPLGSLPVLPPSLLKLGCWQNQLVSLPALPSALVEIKCYQNKLTSLPNLPDSLLLLNCYGNPLIHLPALPSSLKTLVCKNAELNYLPSLPSSLKLLDCSNNNLDTLPVLPDSLSTLFCNVNEINSLPLLPSGLKILICENNVINSLPNLPSSMCYLNCNFNQLTSLPPLPGTLTLLECSDNQLTSLPTLSSVMVDLNISNNPGIHCLPPIDSITFYFKWNNTSINCIPNVIVASMAYPTLSGVPICVKPTKPKSISVSGGKAKVCPGEMRTYTTPLDASVSYYWTVPPGVVINNGQGTRTINVTFNNNFPANDLITVVKVGGCYNSEPFNLRVYRNTPATPSAISANSSGLCGGSSVPFSITNGAGMAYDWTVIPGAVITNGQGTSAITVDFPAGNFTGVISVKAVNACGAGSSRNITVRAAPSTPLSIIGTSTACAGEQNVTYSITSVAGATSYNWAVPTGASIASGQGTTSIVMNYGNAGGNVKVRSINNCGASAYKSLSIIINCKEENDHEEMQVSVYPNPSNNLFTLHYPEDMNDNGELIINNMLGEVLIRKSNFNPGDDFYFGKELPAGIYIATFISGDDRKVLKLVKRTY